MFGKLMNNYYYGKSGKGDYRKEDLPKNRWQLFWEMLKVRFSGIVRLNLMYAVVWLPTMIVLMISALNLVSSLNESMGYTADGTAVVEQAEGAVSTDEADGAVTADETDEPSPLLGMSVNDIFQSVMMSTLVLLIPCIAITGPATAGVCYVTRNWARDEHAFIWSDFKDAVKENWKQALAISVITSLVPMMMYLCWTFYGQMALTSAFMVVPQVLSVTLGMIWALAVTYFYPLMVSYKLRMRDVFRNGFLLAVARLPQSIGIRLLHTVPMVIGLAVGIFINTAWAVLGLFMYYLVLGFGLSRFVTASFTNGVFDKYINSHIEGVQVNRGLNTEPDDDDDDVEDEEDEPQA